MKIGDLVSPAKSNFLAGGRRVGIVIRINTGWDCKQVLVKWDVPLWYDMEGLASEYPDGLVVISKR